MNKFDRIFWTRVWTLTKMYWSSKERRTGVRLLVVVAIMSGALLAAGAYSSYLYRDSTNALVSKNLPLFYHLMLVWTGLTAIFVILNVFEPYYNGRLFIEWREWMTAHFVRQGFAHHAFYRMSQSGKVDNPDQRISDDIGSFVAQTQGFTVTLLFALGGVATYFTILWSISHSLALVLIAYSMLGTYFTVVIGRRLVTIHYDQERYQADFRFGLVHVRDNVEPIFMYGGEDRESGQLMRRFVNVVRNYNLQILWERHLGFFTGSYGGVVALVPFWFLAGTYVSGKLSFGSMSQAASAFISLSASLSIIIDRFPSIADYANVVNRLSEFLDECAAAREAESDGRVRIEMVEDRRVEFAGLNLRTPDGGKTLISDLSADASALKPILIKGPSGVGKTSLMRALAGLWREGSGTITRPTLSEVMFLPQRPYLILGSLREQLTYPRVENATDDDLREILAKVNLADLPDRFGGLDATMHWADVLSPGEQQRLAFARLLLNRPNYAFLDEATSALDPENEERMYDHLRRSGIQFMSSGHRASLLKYHRNVLELRGPDGWRLEPSAEFESAAA
jgi:putative ATP-binding cassette transporter